MTKLENNNLKLRSDLEKETGKVAGLQRDAAEAKAAQQRVETELAKQQERAAKAEKDLLELQERIKPRQFTAEQETRLIAALSAAPVKGPLEIMCVLGDGEGLAFASPIDRILKAAGWSTSGVNQGAFRKNPVGFGIEVRSLRNPIPYVVSLQRAFWDVGIRINVIEITDLNPEVQIMVGNKRNPN